MSSRVQSAYDSLVDELERVFLRVSQDVQMDSETTCIDFVDYDSPYERGRDPGRVIVCDNDTGRLDYVYRLRFRSGDNERERVYWFKNDFGWSDKQQLVGEKDNILAVLKWSEKRVEKITEQDRGRITSMFEELENEISNKRQSMSIRDVKEAVKNENIDRLQNIVSPSRRVATEFWKLLYSYGEDGGRVSNPVSVEFSNDKVALFSSERTYNKQDGTRKYPLYLAVCLDETSDRFITKRIRRTKDVEGTVSWSESEVLNVLGYDRDYKSDFTIDTSERVKLRGDLRTIPHDYDGEKNRYREYLWSSVEEQIARLYTDMYLEKNDLSVTSCARTGHGIRIDLDASTDEIKELQESLEMSEEDIRREQKKREISRLSSRLRAEIVEELFNKYVAEWIYERTKSEIESFQNEKRNFNIKRVRNIAEEGGGSSKRLKDILINNTDDLSEVMIENIVQDTLDEYFEPDSEETVVVGDTIMNFECATSHPRTDYLLEDYKVKSRVIIPEETSVYLNHNDGGVDKLKFKKGVYDFRTLKGMERASF